VVEQSDLLRLALDTLEDLRVPYAIVGSFASGAWGESRFTQDIDILVELRRDQVAPLCRTFTNAGCYVSETAAYEALDRRSQFNVIHPSSGNKIDFMLAGEARWTRDQLQRRRRLRLFPDRDGDVSAPEDVILGKLMYYRDGGSEKHLRDITGILKVSGSTLDRDYIARHAAQLHVSDMWLAILNNVGHK
jgi:hypothetical protein